MDKAKWVTVLVGLLGIGISAALNKQVFDMEGHPWAKRVAQGVSMLMIAGSLSALAYLFGVRIELAGNAASPPIAQEITPCAVRIGNIPAAAKTLQEIKAQEGESFLGRKIVICTDPTVDVAACPFAQDLGELFRSVGLTDVRTEHGQLEGSSVWFEAPQDDVKASEQFYRDMALRGYDLRHYLEPPPSKPKGKPDVVADCGGWPTIKRTWKFYIKDRWYPRQPQ